MKITIDTKEDSHEEIKKVISMLQALVGSRETYSNRDIFSDSSPEVPSSSSGGVFGSLFDSTNKEITEEKKEEPEEKVEIIPY